MKITRKVGANISGVISTGSFENLRPGFFDEIIIEYGEGDTPMSDEEAKERRAKLYEDCYSQMEKAESEAIVKRIQRERLDMRFKWCDELNKDVPSTTSVINFDADFFIDPIELAQYASQSNIVHKKVEYFIKDGAWLEAKEIDDIWADIVIVTKGNLKLSLDTGDFPSFLKKFPVTKMKNGLRTFNLDAQTTGLCDFTGIPDFKGAEKVETVFDVKRTADKVKNGMQLADYCKQNGCKQGIIIPLNDKTEQNYSKPIVYNEKTLEGYYKMFLSKRNDFKKRYSI